MSYCCIDETKRLLIKTTKEEREMIKKALDKFKNKKLKGGRR